MNAHPFGWRGIVSILVPVDVGLADDGADVEDEGEGEDFDEDLEME